MVAEHTVENHIHAAFVAGVDKLPEFLLGAELGVDVEIVVGEIAGGLEFLPSGAIGGVKHRGHPYGVHAQLLDIVKRIYDTSKIAILAVPFGAPHVGIAGSSPLAVLE